MYVVSSAKRENFNHVPQIRRVSPRITHSYHCTLKNYDFYSSLMSSNVTKYLKLIHNFDGCKDRSSVRRNKDFSAKNNDLKVKTTINGDGDGTVNIESLVWAEKAWTEKSDVTFFHVENVCIGKYGIESRNLQLPFYYRSRHHNVFT